MSAESNPRATGDHEIYEIKRQAIRYTIPNTLLYYRSKLRLLTPLDYSLPVSTPPKMNKTKIQVGFGKEDGIGLGL